MSTCPQTVLITGCTAPGIGHALALEFQRRGLRVFATARTTSSIADLVDVGIETLDLVVDEEESIIKCQEEVKRRLGGKALDYLVNNAGVNYTVPALEILLPEARALFEVNFFAVIRIIQTFTPLLLPRPGTSSGGTIVQIGSLAGYIPYVFGSAYNASKAALHAYTSTLRVELAPLGVHVMTIVTGGVKSNIARTHRSLATGSYYQSVEKEYERRQKHSQEVGMETDEYARVVVGKVLGARGRLWDAKSVWVGGSAGRVWWVWSCMPEGVWDWVMGWMFGLAKVRGSARMGERKKGV